MVLAWLTNPHAIGYLVLVVWNTTDTIPLVCPIDATKGDVVLPLQDFSPLVCSIFNYFIFNELSACKKQGEHVLNIIIFNFRAMKKNLLKCIKKIPVHSFVNKV
jgi:hypothetical protein